MILTVKNLEKEFKKIKVLNDVNLVFESGNIYGLSGRNGSGKTVFLKLLCGLIKPSNGEIYYDDIKLNINNGYLFNIGALIENPKFFPDLTGLENLLILAKINNKITEKEILKYMKEFNLLEEKDKKYGNYSLGMKQKLGIIQAIMEDQKIIILDEPFSGIEEQTVNKIKKILINEKNKNKIIIISSHIKEDLNMLTDKLIYFDNGFVRMK